MKKTINEIEDNICGIILLSMTILTGINVFSRYVLRLSMPFVEELTCLGLVIISLVGAATAAKRGAHLGLTLLTDFLPLKAQKACTILGHVLGISFGFVMLLCGSEMVALEKKLEMATSGMQWPEWLFGLVVPVGGAVLIIRYFQLMVREIKGGEEKK